MVVAFGSLAAVAALFGIAPRTLLSQAGTPVSWPWSGRLSLGLAVIGGLVYLVQGGPSTGSSLAFAVTWLCCAAIAYVDFSFLLIPDLYIVTLAIASLFTADRPSPLAALWGGGLASGMLWATRAMWRKRTGDDGLGLGDVKLAGALGLWLGSERVLWVISAGAVSGAVVGVVRNRLAAGTDEAPSLIPFGLTLSLAAALSTVLI